MYKNYQLLRTENYLIKIKTPGAEVCYLKGVRAFPLPIKYNTLLGYWYLNYWYLYVK